MKAYENDNLTEPIFNEFIKLAAFIGNPELCSEAPQPLSQEWLERVYVLQAKTNNSLEICEQINTSVWKNECHAQVLTRRAVEFNKPKICEQISNEKTRLKCQNEF